MKSHISLCIWFSATLLVLLYLNYWCTQLGFRGLGAFVGFCFSKASRDSRYLNITGVGVEATQKHVDLFLPNDIQLFYSFSRKLTTNHAPKLVYLKSWKGC